MKININTKFDLERHSVLINKKQSIIDNQDKLNYIVHHQLINRNYFNEALKYYEIANHIYPDQCDLQLEISHIDNSVKYNLALIIHFPKLTIKNSNHQSHDIKDFFFKIVFNWEKRTGRLRILEFSGQRTTFTYAEYSSEYRFSHMGNYNFKDNIKWLNFCFGDGDIPFLQARFNQTNDEDSSKPSVFTLLLIGIELYLSWESLEGGPYKTFDSVGNRTLKWHEFSLDLSNVDVYSNIISRENSFIDCDIFFHNNICKISDNDKFEQSIITIAKKTMANYENFYYIKSENGDLYEIHSGELKVNMTMQPILFKQELYYYTITDACKSTNKNHLYINPLIKNNVRDKLEFSINSYIIGSSLTKRLQDQSEVD